MVEIKAYIRPRMLDDVVRALRQAGHCCLTVNTCEGTGQYTSPSEEQLSLTYNAMHTKVVKMELVCEEGEENDVISIISEHGRTGYAGDGMVFVSPVTRAVRIRDGRRALHGEQVAS